MTGLCVLDARLLTNRVEGGALRMALVALVMLASAPADAHCFKVWKYPTPQRCGASGASGASGVAIQIPRPAVQKPDDDERVTIEITLTPELLETWARQDALEKIRGELR